MTDQKPTISLAQWCAYLPYGIDVFLDTNAPIQGKYLLQPNNFSTVTYSGMWKPLLRPMNVTKTLKKELDTLLINEYECISDGIFWDIRNGCAVKTLQIDFTTIQLLLQNHYDIFGLIEQGLALPIE